MIKFRKGQAADLPQIKELFKRCFGDSDTFVDRLYNEYCTVEQVLVVEEDGEIDSMLSVLDTVLHLPDGKELPAGYIYGLATNPYIQGKGHARKLMEYADQVLQEQGKQCLLLVPASPSLHRYFETLGLVECFATRKVEIMSAAMEGLPALDDSCKISKATPAEYAALRRELLKDTLHVGYDETLVGLQQFCGQLSGGDLYKLEVEGETGCVAIEYVQKSRMLAKELLIAPSKMNKAVQLIFNQEPAARYHIRIPGSWDGLQGSYVQAFGMVKWYNKQLQQDVFNLHQEAYLGLAFD